MTYYCGKYDEERVPSTCDFKTENGIDMFDHINNGHSAFYCHRCPFKSRKRNEIEDHSHYEDLLDDISNCNICGGPLDDEFQVCEKCLRLPGESSVREEEMLKCDLCDFNTKIETEFNEHQKIESEKLFRSIKEMYKSNENKILSKKSKLDSIKSNVTVNNWFEYLQIADFQECFKSLSMEEKIIEIKLAIDLEFSSRNTRIEIVNKLEHEIDRIFSEEMVFKQEHEHNTSEKDSGIYQQRMHDTLINIQESNEEHDNSKLVANEDIIIEDDLSNISIEDMSELNIKCDNVLNNKNKIENIFDYPEYHIELTCDEKQIKTHKTISLSKSQNFKISMGNYENIEISGSLKQIEYEEDNIDNKDLFYMEKISSNTTNIEDDIAFRNENYFDIIYNENYENISNEMCDIKADKEKCKIKGFYTQDEESVTSKKFIDQEVNFLLKDEINITQSDICNTSIENNTTLERHENLIQEVKWYFCEFCAYKSISEFNMWTHNKILHEKDQIDDFLSDSFYEQNVEPAIINLLHEHNIYSDEIIMETKSKIEDIEYDDSLLTTMYKNEEMITNKDNVKFDAYSTENFNISIKQEIDEIESSEEDNENMRPVSEIANSFIEVKQNNITINQCKITMQLKQNLNTYPQLMDVCEQCHEKSDTNFQIKNHFSKHENNFPCDKCEFLFDSKPHLINHMKCSHEGDILSSNSCDSVFNTNCHLIKHTHSLHNTTKSLCNQCDKKCECKYCSQIMYQNDMKTYMCYQCNLIFTDKQMLKKHMQSIHGTRSKNKDKRMYEKKKKLKMEEIKIYLNTNINIYGARNRFNKRKKIKALSRKRKRKKKLE